MGWLLLVSPLCAWLLCLNDLEISMFKHISNYMNIHLDAQQFQSLDRSDLGTPRAQKILKNTGHVARLYTFLVHRIYDIIWSLLYPTHIIGFNFCCLHLSLCVRKTEVSLLSFLWESTYVIHHAYINPVLATQAPFSHSQRVNIFWYMMWMCMYRYII